MYVYNVGQRVAHADAVSDVGLAASLHTKRGGFCLQYIYIYIHGGLTRYIHIYVYILLTRIPARADLYREFEVARLGLHAR